MIGVMLTFSITLMIAYGLGDISGGHQPAVTIDC